jgi:TolA-binding protein
MDSQTTQQQTDTGALEIQAWFEENKQRLKFVGITALALIVVIVVYRYYDQEKELGASEALSELRLPIASLARHTPATAEQFLRLAEDRAGTAAGPRALLLGAATLFADGKFPEAQAQFEKFVQKYATHALVPQASFGIAACLDAANKPNDAITKYQEVISRFATDMSVVTPARLALGRVYEVQNKFEQATSLYIDISTQERYSSFAEEAMMRAMVIQRDHPEAAKAAQEKAMNALSTNRLSDASIPTPGAPNKPVTVKAVATNAVPAK